MTARLRFAPSPTGHLHIGGARTALYNYLLAEAMGGKFILRIEDTDQERSKREFEQLQIEDLNWLGVDHHEGPDKPGEFGPYRQSERLDIYRKYADQLLNEGKAYYCFLKEEELEQLREKALAEDKSPHFYYGKYRDLSLDEARKRVQAGEKAVIRLKAPNRSYSFNDIVRGEVTFPEDMVGDFVIMRAGGFPLYNFCCVIDDWLMKITHVFRAEEHLNNTVRQLMVYEAFNITPPEFGHVSLIIGHDRQKLSKRHGATSVKMYRDEGYIPDALLNYLVLLGWSHPEEKDIFSIEELKSIFDMKRFSKSPAMYDIEKLNHVNSQHLKNLENSLIVSNVKKHISPNSKFLLQSQIWQESFVELFKEKVNLFSEFDQFVDDIFSIVIDKNEQLQEILNWETTPKILSYLREQINELLNQGKEYAKEEDFSNWSNYIKQDLKIKGKPLFMGMRGVLTGQAHGSDLKLLIPLTPLKIINERMSSL